MAIGFAAMGLTRTYAQEIDAARGERLIAAQGVIGMGPSAKKPKKSKKPKKAAIFVLKNCQTIEQVSVFDYETQKVDHEELTCTCSVRREKLDAKTGKTVIECE